MKDIEKQEIKNETAQKLSKLDEANNKTPIETLECLNTGKKDERRKNKGF